MNKILIISFFNVMSFIFLAIPALASRIDVVNENKKALTIRIKAEGSDAEDPTYVKEIPAEERYKFTVEKADLKGKSFYSIKGDTSPFTPGDKCHLLNVDKNYKVTFLNDAVGTTCVAEEVK